MNKSTLKKLVLSLCIICAVSFTLFFIFAIKTINSANNSKGPYVFGITKKSMENFIKNIHDNNNVNGKSINESNTSNIDGVTGIKVDALSSNVVFSKSKDSIVHASLTGSINANFTPSLKVEKNGETLDINVTHKEYFMTINNSNLKLNIEIPENYSGSLNIINDSGSIKNTDKFSFSSLDLNCDSGNIELSNLTSKLTTLKCDSGNMNLNYCSFSNLKLNLDSGNAVITNYKGSIEGKADSSNINISYETFNNTINLSLDSGSINVTLPKNSNFNLDAICDSGNIKCSYPLIIDNLGDDKEHLKGKSGNGENNIILKVDSGDIRIN